MKSKKKVLGVFKGSFETLTRYSGVYDTYQKKVLGILKGSFLRNLIVGVIAFQYHQRRNYEKKCWKLCLI